MAMRDPRLLLLLACGLGSLLLACGPGTGHTVGPGDGMAALVAEADQRLALSMRLDYKAPRSSDRLKLRKSAFELYAKVCAGRAAGACWRALEVLPRDDHREAMHDVLVGMHKSAFDLYTKACAGHAPRACWRVLEALPRDDHREAMHDVLVGIGKSCVEGDATSCEVLVGAEFLYEGPHDDADLTSLCAHGLTEACQLTAREACRTTSLCQASRACAAGDTFACDRELKARGVAADVKTATITRANAAAATECTRGTYYACWWLLMYTGDSPKHESDRKYELVIGAASDACSRGILDQCGNAADVEDWKKADPKMQAAIYKGHNLSCRRWGRCGFLEAFHAPDGPHPDVAAHRDAREHGCQLADAGNDFYCLDLAKAYLEHELPEPVPGRGKELASYLCSIGDKKGCAALEAADASR
jgi:hypothetical protein